MPETPKKPPNAIDTESLDPDTVLQIFSSPQEMLKTVKDIDTDGDKRFSRKEMANGVIDYAKTFPLNDDGTVTGADYMARIMTDRETFSDDRLKQRTKDLQQKGDAKDSDLATQSMRYGERTLVEGGAAGMTVLFSGAGQMYQVLDEMPAKAKDTPEWLNDPENRAAVEQLKQYNFMEVEPPTLDDIAKVLYDQPIPHRKPAPQQDEDQSPDR